MDIDINLELYPIRSVYSVLGNICKNPRLLRDPDVNLVSDDFYQEFHELTFCTISNIVYSVGEKESVTPVEVDNYLSEYPRAYKKWQKHEGLSYLAKAIEFAKKDSFELDYQRLKKFSLLRKAYSKGMDITHFYDLKGNIDENMKALDEYEINDIIDYYSRVVLDLRDSFSTTNKKNAYKAGEGLRDTIKMLHDEPQYGIPFRNQIYNTLFRGMSPGRFMLRSADSGVGKTRNNLNDMCYVSMGKIWSHEHNKFIETGAKIPTLYLGSEEEKQETDITMLAIVSGVDEGVIKDGNYSMNIQKRLDIAIDIIEDSELYIHREDDFSITDIEMIIESYILDYNIQNVAFDYIQLTPKISRSMVDKYGIQMREDQILKEFSLSLKNIADVYGIFILSNTQLNRNSLDKTQRNATCLAGGKATSDKVDFGVLLFRVDNQDLGNLQHVLNAGYEKPNYSHWVYKNRSGGHSDCIIWTKMDLGNMVETPLFVTDRQYNLLEIDKTEIKIQDNGEAEVTKTKGESANHFNDYISVPEF